MPPNKNPFQYYLLQLFLAELLTMMLFYILPNTCVFIVLGLATDAS